MRNLIYKGMGGFALAAFMCISTWAANDHAGVPGTLNYIEGQASIGNETLDSKSVGATQLDPGESLATDHGRAEVLLTPGAFLRLDNNSAVKMISSGLTNTEVEVNQGRATIEVTDIHNENNLRVRERGVTTQLLKTGLYTFDADQGKIRVFDGKAVVFDGDRPVEVKGGRVVTLATGVPLNAQKFDKKQYQDDFYAWSKVRSEYLAEANASAAQTYVTGTGWYGPGWYWNPWYGSYTFIPGNGIFYSPFGFGYYSPGLVYSAPLYYRGYVPGRRWVVPRVPGHVYGPGVAGQFRGGRAGGFHGRAGHR